MSSHLHELYNQNAYDPQQKYELYLADEAHLDIDLLANPKYDADQMKEIRLGLESGVDPKLYARLNIDAKDMKHIRETAENNSFVYEEKYEEIANKKTKRYIYTGIAVFVALCLIFTVFWQKETLAKYVTPLTLELKKDSVRLGVSKVNSIDLMEYVKDYDKDYQLKYTPTISSKIGTQTITYSLSNGVKTKKRYLDVKVYDDISPTLELTKSNVGLEYGSSFDSKSIISKAYDNYDEGDLKDNVKIEGTVNTSKSGKYELKYSLSDKTGNITTQKVTVVVNKKVVENTTNNSSSSSRRNNSGNNTTSNSSSRSYRKSAVNKTFYFSNSSNMSATYSKAVSYAQSQLNAGKARGYNVTPIKGSDGVYTGYRVTFS